MDSMYEYRYEGRTVPIIDECKHCGEFILRGDTYHEINEGIVHERCLDEYKVTMEYYCKELETKLNEVYDLSKESAFDFIHPLTMEELRVAIGKVLLKIESREEYYGE